MKPAWDNGMQHKNSTCWKITSNKSKIFIKGRNSYIILKSLFIFNKKDIKYYFLN